MTDRKPRALITGRSLPGAEDAIATSMARVARERAETLAGLPLLGQWVMTAFGRGVVTELLYRGRVGFTVRLENGERRTFPLESYGASVTAAPLDGADALTTPHEEEP